MDSINTEVNGVSAMRFHRLGDLSYEGNKLVLFLFHESQCAYPSPMGVEKPKMVPSPMHGEGVEAKKIK